MIGEIPYFDIHDNGFLESKHGPVIDTEAFYKRMIEFIDFNIKSNYEINILCYFVDTDGTTMEAKLEKEGYAKSLLMSLQYYKEQEEYEACEKITNLIKEYELQ